MVGVLAHASGMSTFHLVIAVGDAALRAEAGVVGVQTGGHVVSEKPRGRKGL